MIDSGKSLLLLLCVLLGVAHTACVPSTSCARAGNTEAICTYTGPEAMNARLEVVGQAELRESKTVWLENGEQLVPLWDTFTYYFTAQGETCDFTNLTAFTESCSVCDLCGDAVSFQRCGFQGFVADAGENRHIVSPKVIAFEGVATEGQELFALDFLSGCSAGGISPVLFTPSDNFTYQLLAPLVATTPGALAQKKVFLIQNGMPQSTSYELKKYAEDLSQGKEWYMWTVLGSPVWDDNFSENLRIGQVRILTGRPGTDPNTGRFRLEDAKVVRPSRILFFSDFVARDTSNGNVSDGSDILTHGFEDDNRCYVDSTKEDGDINLVSIPMRTRCRQNEPGQPAEENDFIATPTYLLTEPASQLTWFVEFYRSQGADFDPATPAYDPIPLNAVLAIEFSIEKAP